ncbi:MAG TPA: rod shape-determining protein [Pyrinomonadaceae bacterium]|jgi:rod shape-determining protein MreB|nr:rod shape-determining protein [Pyrinomonadaceae bacterium]
MLRRNYKRRNSSFWHFQTLRDLVSDSMAIDMGSSNTVIAVRGRGVVVDEPSVVAVNKMTGEVVAIGREAHEMQGREAREVTLVRPLVDGVVADFDNTRKMLSHFVRAARGGISHFSRRAVMSVLSGVTHVEQRALLTAAEHAHIGRIYMVEEGLASAIGAGVSVEDKQSAAVVDLGGDSTNIAVVALGMIVYSRAERTGSNDIDAALMERLRRFRGLSIGGPTAERLKIELGSAIEPADPARSVSVKGREVTTGRPGAIDVTADEVYAVAQPILLKIAEGVREALSGLQPEVVSDIYERGLIVTGGGALLEGLGEFLHRETSLATRVVAEPRHACVMGLTQLFDSPPLLRRVTRSEPSLLDAESMAEMT